MYKPNAYYLRGALPNEAQSREEYVGTVYGAVALGYVTMIKTADAMDALQERLPDEARKARRFVNNIMGSKGGAGQLALLRIAFNDHFVDKGGTMWAANFGNAVYGAIEDDMNRLQTAIANELGKYKGVPDINVCAAIIVAQSLADEAANYVDRRAGRFKRFTLVTHTGMKVSVAQDLRTMSCAGLEFNLRNICYRVIGPYMNDDTDLLASDNVTVGVKAVLNRLCDVKMWEQARDKADELSKN